MTQQNLEQKTEELEIKMPGIKEILKFYSGAYAGEHWDKGVKDISYLETDKYQVVAAMWDEHSWSEYGGGVEWKNWISLYYKIRGSDQIVNFLNGKEIVTRHRTNPNYDRRDLWKYKYVDLKQCLFGEDCFEVAWKDEEGKTAYETGSKFNLSDGKIMNNEISRGPWM